MDKNYPIMKNTNVYKVLKMANGINLDRCKKRLRADPITGVSSRRYGMYWFYTSKGRGIFKTYQDDMMFGFKYTELRLVNELLYGILGEQIGVSCAKYEPANYQGLQGLVSFDVADKKERLISLKEISRKFLPGVGFKYYKYYFYDQEIETDKKQLDMDVFKMATLDALTIQEDRHSGNIHVLINKRNNKFRLSPIIDNEFAFAGKTFDYLARSFYRPEVDVEYFLQKSDLAFRMNAGDFFDAMYYPLKTQIKQVVELAKNDKDKKTFLFSAIKNINIKKALKDVEKMGYKISDDYKQYAYDIIELSMSIFEEEIKKIGLKEEQITQNIKEK